MLLERKKKTCALFLKRFLEKKKITKEYWDFSQWQQTESDNVCALQRSKEDFHLFPCPWAWEWMVAQFLPLCPAALRPSHTHCTSVMDGGMGAKHEEKKEKSYKGGQSRVEMAHCTRFWWDPVCAARCAIDARVKEKAIGREKNPSHQ